MRKGVLALVVVGMMVTGMMRVAQMRGMMAVVSSENAVNVRFLFPLQL